MPQDALQIALEHHRSGRLRQAEAEYRSILAADPRNAEARLWLGMLIVQAGQPQQAIEHLQWAAKLRPADVSVWHNLGQACLKAGRAAEAVEALQRARELDRARGATLFLLGVALLARRSENDARLAAQMFLQAASSGMDSPDVHYYRAVALLAANDPEAALAACRTGLEKHPEHALIHYQQALAHRALEQPREVRKALLKAVESDARLAQAWTALAHLDAEAGQFAIAASLFRRAIKANPAYVPAHEGLGQVLERLGETAEATKAFLQAAHAAAGTAAPAAAPLAIALAELEQRVNDPIAAEFHYALAGQFDLFPPAQIPTQILTSFYDRYAERFEKHLRGTLKYQAPEMILQAILATRPERKLDMLDLGCGTGICGELLRPLAGTLDGVDLSQAMVDRARARNVYDHLEVGNLVDVLLKRPRRYDLLVSADVLIYIGDLGPAFEAAAGALRPGGLFVFTVEAGEGERYQFRQQTRRFTHSKTYLQHLASIHGFREESFENIVPRMEAQQPVPGYLILLRWPGD